MRPCSLLEITSNEVGLALCSWITCQLLGSGNISGHQRPQMNELQPLDHRHGDNYSNLLILRRALILRLCTSNHNCYSTNDGESFPVDVGRPRNSQSPDSGHQRVTYTTAKAKFRHPLLSSLTELVRMEDKSNKATVSLDSFL